ncbi:PhoD-like phosphatase-domain-containing protein [Biscogniauxia mediterranea]|nr:PhoD-like phosphatase-domain-containing protein [Biscogniauxia mediterranea]
MLTLYFFYLAALGLLSARTAIAAAAAAAAATSLFDGNLNYASPSRRHASLGIDVPRVARRGLLLKRRGGAAYAPGDLGFTHGVASGDPLADAVVLWTRVAPSPASDPGNATVEGPVPLYSHDTETYVKADPNPICVEWRVFLPGDESEVVGGRAYTTSDIDYTVKVDATGLQPFTTYNYQFSVCGSNNTSPVGRTKTAPEADADVSEVKLAVFSCSNYPIGYFNAYGNAARKDEHDYIVHLGDYIYETGIQGERAHDPPRYLFTLHDYRTRHGQYRTDPDLQLASQNFAWIATWDDHEVSDNGYRDGSSALNNTEDSFLRIGHGVSVDQRKMNAVRAYFEWMPIRQVDLDDNLRVWRTFQMGKLFDLIILDTRNYDRSITSLNWNNDYISMISNDASRSLMGSHQENWFYNELTKSAQRGATWRIVGNQVIFSHIVESFGLNGDNWNGYVANRNRTLKHLYDNNIGNNIFLAGDSHQNWVSDLVWLDEKPYNSSTGSGSIGVEFAGTAVSSSGASGPIAAARRQARARVAENAVLQWQDGYYRGYFLLAASRGAVEARFYGSPSVASRNAWDLPLANFTVRAGDNRLARPVAGGAVEAGALRGGVTRPTNVSLDTATGEWRAVGFDQMYINTTA